MAKRKRKCNDFGKSVKPQTAVKLLTAYRAARKAGYTREEAARWSMTDTEQQLWHSNSGGKVLPDRKTVSKDNRYKWFHNRQNIVASYKRLGQLLDSIGAKSLLTKKGNVEMQVASAVIAQNPKFRQARCNYENVTGLKLSQRLWSKAVIYNRGTVLLWLKINRGKQLFIRGWGGFDIPQAAADTTGDRWSSRYILTPMHIQATGYGMPSWYVLEHILSQQASIDWIARYRQWWWDEVEGSARRRRLDEIGVMAAVERLTANPAVHPQQLLDTIEEELQERQDQLWGRDIPLEPVSYPVEQLPTIQTRTGLTVQPVKTSDQLVEVGKSLHNCAASYHNLLKDGTKALMVCTTEQGKPVGLAELTFDKHGVELGQVAGPCNQDVTEEVERAFFTCLDAIVNK